MKLFLGCYLQQTSICSFITWRQAGDIPLPVSLRWPIFFANICVTRSRWAKTGIKWKPHSSALLSHTYWYSNTFIDEPCVDEGSRSVQMKRCSKYFDKATIFGVENVILIRAFLVMFPQNVLTYPYFDFIGDNIRDRYRPGPYLGGKRCSSGHEWLFSKIPWRLATTGPTRWDTTAVPVPRIGWI